MLVGCRGSIVSDFGPKSRELHPRAVLKVNRCNTGLKVLDDFNQNSKRLTHAVSGENVEK